MENSKNHNLGTNKACDITFRSNDIFVVILGSGATLKNANNF